MSAQTIRAIFIRHGESTANAGEPTDIFSEIPLTPLGVRQAKALAAAWTFTPGLIAMSPYLRTRQTAQPTIERFPQVPVEIWPIQEFTYWDRGYWNGSRPEDEWAEVERYWAEADPDYRQGQHAESFAMLLRRVHAALQRLEQFDVEAPVLLFTHGHFMQALRHSFLYPKWSAQQTMRNFREFDELRKVKNTELIEMEFASGSWRMVEASAG